MLHQNVDPATLKLYKEKFSAKDQHVSKSWLDMFVQNADNGPDLPAIINPNGLTLSYAEVMDQSKKFERYFHQEISSSPGFVVALALSRTNVHIAPLFVAILKAGGAVYLVEPKLGDAVNRYRLKLIKVDLLIMDDENSELAKDMDGVSTLVLEEHVGMIDKLNGNLISSNRAESSVAYIVCSSGTTGEPKVIYLTPPHMSDVTISTNQFLTKQTGRNRVLQLSRRCFDASVFEIMVALGTGASLVLIDYETSLSPTMFDKFIRDFSVTFMLITPSHMNYLHRESTSLSTLETVILGGEVADMSLVNRVASSGVERIVDFYGPSECGIMVLYSILYEKLAGIIEPILQYPTLGCNIRVVRQNEMGQQGWELCPLGQQGELIITNTLQNVYRNQANNDCKYVYLCDPVSGKTDCFYRTGDIFDVTEEEVIKFFGRKDNQVKIFGQLVVTDEVANQFKNVVASLFPEQKIQIYVSVEYDSNGKPIGLRAYHTSKSQENAEMIARAASSALSKVLPKYMLPKAYYWLHEFKIKIGGKMDTQYPESIVKSNKGTPIQTEVERKIAQIWSDLLGIKRNWMREDRFSDMGGSSLLAMAMYAEISETFSVQLKAADYVNSDSLDAIAADVINATTYRKGVRCGPKKVHVQNAVNSFVRMRVSATNEFTLYVVHPGDGHIQIYLKIVDGLPDSYSVYGFRAPGSEDGEEVANLTVQEYAQRYTDRIIQQQGVDKNPIHLLGYCGGGPICIEMASMIQERGYEVQSLTVCDIPNPFHVKGNNDTACWISTFFNELYALAIDPDEVRSLATGFSEQFKVCYEYVVERGLTSMETYEITKKALQSSEMHIETRDEAEIISLFFKQAFQMNIDERDLEQFDSNSGKIEHFVEEGKRRKLIPDSLGISYFERMVKMSKQMIDCLYYFIPRPVSIASGRVMYLYTSPNRDLPMPWYPLYDTWKGYIPQATVHKFSEYDHHSLLREPAGVRALVERLRQNVE